MTVEQLEDRTVPSNFTAATASDLIADINAANQQGGSNTITLVAPTTSPYVLAAVDNNIDGATGLPVIAATDNLTIVGNGDTIERSAAVGTPEFRLFDVAAGASLTMRNLTLQNGLAHGGGAIYSQGSLDLNGLTVQYNQAWGAGGELYVAGGTANLAGTTVSTNLAQGGAGSGVGGNGAGGGLYVASGTVTLTNDTLSGNRALGGTGGYYGYVGGNGLGGGLFVAGGTVTLSGDTLSANSAQGGQGGPGAPGFHGLWWHPNGWPGGTGGTGGTGGNGFGGALYVAAGSVTLTGNTVSFNSAWGGVGGSGGSGGNGYYRGSSGSSGLRGLGEGGGLYIATAASLSLDAFTLANTTNNSPDQVFGSYTLRR